MLYVYAFVFLPTVHTSYGLLPLCREQSRRTLKVEIEAATPYPIARALQQPMQSTQKVSKRHPRRTQEAPSGTEKVCVCVSVPIFPLEDWGPEIIAKLRAGSWCPRSDPRATKVSQERTQSHQEARRSLAERPAIASRAPQSRPKGTQEPPTDAPRET